MIIEASKLKEREVINVCDGKNLGYVCDFLVDTDCGRIAAVFVSDHVFGFAGRKTKRIPWEKITCIGEDTVLVDIGRGGDGGSDCCDEGKKPKKRPGWMF